MLPETHQVLLLHKNRGTHVVAEVGQEVEGFIVDEINDDEVTLIAPSGVEVILAAPDMTWRRRAAQRKAAAAKKGPAAPAAAIVATGPDAHGEATPAGPVDPYAEPTAATGAGTAAPADPYADYDPGISAFVDAVGAQPVPAAEAPNDAPKSAKAANTPKAKQSARTGSSSSTSSTDAASSLAAAATGEVVPTPAHAPAAGPAAASPSASASASGAAAITLARADVDAALSDFGATAVTFDAKFVADGLRIDSIAPGTILAKAGLHKGDTITAVDGKPLRSFDDAADLYARMQAAKAATISVQRAGKPVTLKVTIR
jgi:membrane-associated protease RseP (regulator of RpoE activity)